MKFLRDVSDILLLLCLEFLHLDKDQNDLLILHFLRNVDMK